MLAKELDFSCYVQIAPSGTVSIEGVQCMRNNGFNYSGSESAEPAFLEQLDRQGYFPYIRGAANALWRDGYFGPVCFDSMKLADGTLRHIVEINARMSMGFINFQLDKKLRSMGASSRLTVMSLAWESGRCDYERLIEQLDREGLLFRKERPFGIT
ncbi:hypothetical protein FE782_00810 [Paenibacillus antri]|uniref:ATP-grasp domain-containing protein n=1 Tax=Paenibacillus antri TaxID=2582848 RepID=A0A5R9GHH7_9BACL|nr:hypothetical protein [Paenibacillus antri]TLS53926.1 hypothetical protein FE782_00810 [Paenibacillus antri]